MLKAPEKLPIPTRGPCSKSKLLRGWRKSKGYRGRKTGRLAARGFGGRVQIYTWNLAQANLLSP
jgi:hypothetical protein